MIECGQIYAPRVDDTISRDSHTHYSNVAWRRRVCVGKEEMDKLLIHKRWGKTKERIELAYYSPFLTVAIKNKGLNYVIITKYGHKMPDI